MTDVIERIEDVTDELIREGRRWTGRIMICRDLRTRNERSHKKPIRRRDGWYVRRGSGLFKLTRCKIITLRPSGLSDRRVLSFF